MIIKITRSSQSLVLCGVYFLNGSYNRTENQLTCAKMKMTDRNLSSKQVQRSFEYMKPKVRSDLRLHIPFQYRKKLEHSFFTYTQYSEATFGFMIDEHFQKCITLYSILMLDNLGDHAATLHAVETLSRSCAKRPIPRRACTSRSSSLRYSMPSIEAWLKRAWCRLLSKGCRRNVTRCSRHSNFSVSGKIRYNPHPPALLRPGRNKLA